jgi:hypothetical protein
MSAAVPTPDEKLRDEKVPQTVPLSPGSGGSAATALRGEEKWQQRLVDYLLVLGCDDENPLKPIRRHQRADSRSMCLPSCFFLLLSPTPAPLLAAAP